MEDSAAIYKNYIFMADNGGNMMCLDLNTMKLVWVQDILDDSNSTPVLSVENGASVSLCKHLFPTGMEKL